MADDGTKLNTYTADSEIDRIEPTVLYPIIAGVFLMFCALSIAAFLTSNKRCCKPKKQDPESIILKQQLHDEQKRLSQVHFTLPLGDHPSFTSIMQQEENDIAAEVKESYKSISLDISKPIICCPDHKMSYVYEPKEISNGRSLSKGVIQCNKKCALQENEKVVAKDFDATVNGSEVKKRFYIAPSEIERAEDVKALYFEKWLKQTEENEMGELKSESDFRFEKLELSYDDVESILTSISRMDSNRLQRLKDTKFYQNLMNNIDIPQEECVENDTSIESVDLREIDDVIIEKTGKTNSQCNFTHDEIMSVFNMNKEGHEIFEEIDNRVKNLANNDANNDVNKCQELSEAKSFAKFNKSVIPISESLFKVVHKIPPSESETSLTENLISKTHYSKEHFSSSNKHGRSSSISESDMTLHTLRNSRPNTLDLKVKNSDLSLDSEDTTSRSTMINSFSTSKHSGSKNSYTKSSCTKSSYMQNSYKKASNTTSWHDIYNEKKQRKRDRKFLTGKDENLNVIARSRNGRKSQSDSRSSISYFNDFIEPKKHTKIKRKTQNLSRSSSIIDQPKQSKIKHLKTSQQIKPKNKSFDSSFSIKQKVKSKISRRESTSSTTTTSDFNTTLQ